MLIAWGYHNHLTYNMGKYHWSTELVEQLHQLILSHRNIIILPHTAPDGDALGSTLAWAKVLQAAHPEATIVYSAQTVSKTTSAGFLSLMSF